MLHRYNLYAQVVGADEGAGTGHAALRVARNRAASTRVAAEGHLDTARGRLEQS